MNILKTLKTSIKHNRNRVFFSFIFLLVFANLINLLFIKNNLLNKIKNTSYEHKREKKINKLAESPIIFIGGYARSGTTLIRAILDVHSEVYCGPETKILPMILKFIRDVKTNNAFIADLENAHINITKIDQAIALFINHILENKKEIKNIRKCCKDPNILYYLDYLHKIFPKAKFIYMVRDGRGAAYSLMKRFNEPMDKRSIHNFIDTWNRFNSFVNYECQKVGPEFCLRVRYEDLVLNPKETVNRVVKFLNLTWTDEFLHHEKYVGKKIVISDSEWSTDQIKRKIYNDSLKSWQGKFNYDKNKFNLKYNMFKEFGYKL